MIAQMLQSLKMAWRTERKQRKHGKTKKMGYPREQVENADLYKPVLSKIMGTHE